MRTALLTVLLALLAAAPAQAGVITLSSRFVDGYKGSGYTVSGLRYAAAPGERNAVELTVNERLVTLHDSAGVTPAPGCTATSPEEASCLLATSDIEPRVELGDGDDVAHVRAPEQLVSVYGGDGDDQIGVDATGLAELSGGSGNDTLTDLHRPSPWITPDAASAVGGPGDDVLRGVRAVYRDERAPVRVDLAAGVATTAEGTDTLIDVHAATGGRAGDTIAGGPADDDLWGGPGADRISGRAGNDDLDGGSGHDVLDGGAGNDSLVGVWDPLGDVLRGGRGRDTLSGGEGPDRLVGGAGRDLLEGGGGDDLLDSRDGEPDRDRCGGGNASRTGRARADRRDRVTGCAVVSRRQGR